MKKGKQVMSTQDNLALVQRWFNEVFTQGNLSVADEIFAADYVNHDPTGWPQGPQGAKAAASAYRAGYSDLAFTIEDQIADGDRVATRWTAHGTHDGELYGVPPTGKKVTVTGISIERVAGGKIAETWVNFDALGMLQQLGVVPTMG